MTLAPTIPTTLRLTKAVLADYLTWRNQREPGRRSLEQSWSPSFAAAVHRLDANLAACGNLDHALVAVVNRRGQAGTRAAGDVLDTLLRGLDLEEPALPDLIRACRVAEFRESALEDAVRERYSEAWAPNAAARQAARDEERVEAAAVKQRRAEFPARLAAAVDTRKTPLNRPLPSTVEADLARELGVPQARVSEGLVALRKQRGVRLVTQRRGAGTIATGLRKEREMPVVVSERCQERVKAALLRHGVEDVNESVPEDLKRTIALEIGFSVSAVGSAIAVFQREGVCLNGNGKHATAAVAVATTVTEVVESHLCDTTPVESHETAQSETRALFASGPAVLPARPPRPAIVCLCGSTKFKQAFIQANFRETMAGRIVLSVGAMMHADAVPITPEQKIGLDQLHFRKIELADEVLILDVGGYVGESTRNELQHAQALGKRVRRLSEEMPDYREPDAPNVADLQAERADARERADAMEAMRDEAREQAETFRREVLRVEAVLEAERERRRSDQGAIENIKDSLVILNDACDGLAVEVDDPIRRGATAISGLRADLDRATHEMLGWKELAGYRDEANERLADLLLDLEREVEAEARPGETVPATALRIIQGYRAGIVTAPRVVPVQALPAPLAEQEQRPGRLTPEQQLLALRIAADDRLGETVADRLRVSVAVNDVLACVAGR